MKFPDKIKIGAHEYQTLFPYLFKERIDFCGQSDYYQGIIRIADVDCGGVQRTDASVKVTFIHELIHAILHIYHGATDHDERLVEALAQGLVQVFTDNNINLIGPIERV